MVVAQHKLEKHKIGPFCKFLVNTIQVRLFPSSFVEPTRRGLGLLAKACGKAVVNTKLLEIYRTKMIPSLPPVSSNSASLVN